MRNLRRDRRAWFVSAVIVTAVFYGLFRWWGGAETAPEASPPGVEVPSSPSGEPDAVPVAVPVAIPTTPPVRAEVSAEAPTDPGWIAIADLSPEGAKALKRVNGMLREHGREAIDPKSSIREEDVEVMIAAVGTLDAELVESYKDCSSKMNEITEAARVEIERCLDGGLPVPFPPQGQLPAKTIDEWQGLVMTKGQVFDVRLSPVHLVQERTRYRDAEAHELLFFDSTVRGMFRGNNR